MLLTGLYGFMVLISGCAIICALAGPDSAPPDGLKKGVTQREVDTIYGYPVAVGMSTDGSEYVEQVQFIDGSTPEAKLFRFLIYAICDAGTYMFTELLFFPIEMSIQEQHGRYVYFIVYDDENKIVRAMDIDSSEGRMLYALPWAASRPRCIHENPNCDVCKKQGSSVSLVYRCVHGNKSCPHPRKMGSERSGVLRIGVSERRLLRETKSNAVGSAEGAVTSSRIGESGDNLRPNDTGNREQNQKPYSVELFERENGDTYSYRFILRISDTVQTNLLLSSQIQADLRQSVRADYIASHGVLDEATLQITFPKYSFREGKIEGRAVIMAIELLEFVYDPDTAHGRLAVKVKPQQYEATRQWVRSNIATLVKDKAVAGAANRNFTIGRELLRDGNVFEVEFSVHTGKP